VELVFIHGPAAVGKCASRERELRAANAFASLVRPDTLIARDTRTLSAREAALEVVTALRGTP
jgi:hypothetical protein